jgi:hypothetical protein
MPTVYFVTLSVIGEAACSQPPAPAYGTIDCQKVGADVVCTVACTSSFFKFESQPAPEYRCTPDGTWTPSVQSIPNCAQGKRT